VNAAKSGWKWQFAAAFEAGPIVIAKENASLGPRLASPFY